MTLTYIRRFFVTLAILLAVSVSNAALAEDLIVEHNPTNGHYSTIQAAIDHATLVLNNPATSTTLFRIIVQADPVPYASFTPISNVPIIGTRTSGTFLSGTGTLINMTGVSSVTIRNFTFLNGSIGISITNSSSINITNNVFNLGKSGTAIQVVNPTAIAATSPSIVNNTFFNNGTAISTNADIPITNNIFSTNNVAVATSTVPTQITFDDFFNNGSIGITTVTGQFATADPLFVSPANGDFHLQSGSPCANTGSPNFINSFNSGSDMGAYGGPASDIVIPTVTGLTATLDTTTTSATITLNWNATGNNQIKGYRVYYGTSSGNYTGTQATEGNSPFTVLVPTITAALSGLPVTGAAVPAAPIFTSIVPLDQALRLSWTTVPGATGYRIYYSTASFDAATLPATSVDVAGGAASSFQLSGLTNGTTYFVAVSALAQTTFYAAVTAVIDTSIAIAPNPGSANESSYSLEISQAVGPQQVSTISNLLSDFPETISPYPNLKNEGCFIATAAYGFYSAPQVQALRDFRDRYLLTNGPGRAFVAWYYHYGPRGAHFINSHPYLKPLVRIALFPLVCGSMLLLNPATGIKMALLISVALAPLIFVRRKKLLIFGPTLKKILLTLSLVLIPVMALAGQDNSDQPNWSLELKGGAFFPAAPRWSDFYGNSYTSEFGGALAYKIIQQVEIGIEGTYVGATGNGQALQHGRQPAQASQVSYELIPLNVFVLARGVFAEDQLLVPYVGGGWTRMFYREEIKGQGQKVQGSTNGYHARGGIQLLLDRIDPVSAKAFYNDFHVRHTYFFAEAKYTHAMAGTNPTGSVNLGGSSYLGGLLFEF